MIGKDLLTPWKFIKGTLGFTFFWFFVAALFGQPWRFFFVGIVLFSAGYLAYGTVKIEWERAKETRQNTQRHRSGFLHHTVEPIERRLNDLQAKVSSIIAEERSIRLRAENHARVSITASRKASERLVRAQARLDEARNQFRVGALVAFWDCVEQSAAQVALISNDLSEARAAKHKHLEAVRSYSGNERIGVLAVSSTTVAGIGAAANSIAGEISQLSYEAQFSPAFAQIYEMRRNTATIVSGFGSMHAAINNLGARLESAIGDLSASLDAGLRTVASSMDRLEGSVVSGLRSIEQELMDGKKISNDRLEAIQAAARESIDLAVSDSKFSRAAIIEGIKSDYETRVMIAGISREISPQSLGRVREIYGSILDPGPRLP